MIEPGHLDWQYRGGYIRTRSRRRLGDIDIEPFWADEAFADENALVDSPDRAERLEGELHPRQALLGGQDMNREELERLIAEEVEASERTRDEPLSEGAVRKRQTQSVVYSIRLTPEQTEEIQRIADSAGVPAAGIVRGWVLQGLAAERDGSVEQTMEALSRDLERLRRQLTARRAS